VDLDTTEGQKQLYEEIEHMKETYSPEHNFSIEQLDFLSKNSNIPDALKKYVLLVLKKAGTYMVNSMSQIELSDVSVKGG